MADERDCPKCGMPQVEFLAVWLHVVTGAPWCPKQSDYALAGEAKD